MQRQAFSISWPMITTVATTVLVLYFIVTIVADETHFVTSSNCGFAFLASRGVVRMRCFVLSLTILHWDGRATKERRVHFHIWYNLRRIFLPGQNFNLRSSSTSLSYETKNFFVKCRNQRSCSEMPKTSSQNGLCALEK
jgi:predicted CDP-diglyceride synthetase/phosphatidate cytidylyltransferase